jgi:2-keto-4-pentenoate hydratase/2-oxohepta-3-ene-1,7-dioic acid hydratase in catechol pathway
MLIARILGANGRVAYAEYKDGAYYLIRGDILGGFAVTDEEIRAIKVLPPVSPSKIVAVGGNYFGHRRELNMSDNKEPVIFLKPPTSIIATGDAIVLPSDAERVDYEAELAIVIGSRCKGVKREDADKYILGYTCANDVSERVMQSRDGQWARAKGFDTFCPIGPYIATDIGADALSVRTYVNGRITQSGNTSDMIYSVHRLVEFVSGVMTLLPGDIILTGTPEGVGEIKTGDLVEIEIQNVGTLANTVV